MLNREKHHKKNSTIKFDILTITILLITVIISILLKNNIVILLEVIFIGVIFIGFIYINEKILLIFSILGILLTPAVSNFNGSLSNIPYIVMSLLFIKLLEKKIILKQKIQFNKVIILSTLMLFIINIFSLVYNHYNTSIMLIILYSLKKFSFLILYLFFINVDITKKNIKNILNIIIIFGLIQYFAVVIQFAEGLRQDRLGGMFGDFGTGIMIQFLTIMLILITVLKDKIIKIPFLDFIVVIFSLIYSAMGEVKIGFIIIPFIYFLVLLLKGEKIKIIITICLLFFSLIIIYPFFVELYPGQDILLSSTETEEYLENAYGFNQVNRTGFLPLLKSTVIDTSEKQLFGTGLTTLNRSKVASLQGFIMKKYDYLNIDFFALPYSITENGMLGTFIWLMIYIYIFIINIKEYLINKSIKSIVNIALIIDTFVFIFYNSSILTSFSIILTLWVIISYFNSEKFNLLIEN